MSVFTVIPELFTIQMHHDRIWYEEFYKDVYVAWFDYFDKDLISLIEIDEMAECLGYDGFILYYYMEPSTNYEDGLRLVEHDSDVL